MPFQKGDVISEICMTPRNPTELVSKLCREATRSQPLWIQKLSSGVTEWKQVVALVYGREEQSTPHVISLLTLNSSLTNKKKFFLNGI
jgi:hypothetical protein